MRWGLDAAERLSATCFYVLAEKLDTTLEEPLPELLAEMLGITVPVAAVFFKWHERPAARKAGRNKIVHTAVFLDRVKSKLSAAGLACAVDLSLTAAMGMMQNYSSKIAFSMPLPRTRNFGRASWSCLPCRIEGSRNKRQAGCRVET